MIKRMLAIAACLAVLLCGCTKEVQPSAGATKDKPIVVGFSQIGAESEWRVANTESVKSSLSEDNGYDLIFDDARQEQENQIRAIRTFIQQGVDYIVFSPKVETGWETVLQEAKVAGIPVIMIDRDIEAKDKGLITACIGSDFRKEGEKAVQWLEKLMVQQGRGANPIRIVDIQGTMGSAAQVGRTAAMEQAIARHSNWKMVVQECGDFTRAKTYEVMKNTLKRTKDIDVVYCENDGEALGAIDAMEEAGLKCNAHDGVIVISFDATKLALKYCLEGKIALDVECNPLQGPYVDGIIKRLQRGEPIEKVKYIDETQFDYFTITKGMIENRKY
ncbi:MAG: ABC transporter substrate-binding protein [Bacillota bacterium]|nr:ABC transporter substrate-binding protein [Bacillota bacterium]